MATLTISTTSPLGTDQVVLSFSNADAQRIFKAYQKQFNPGGTQAQFVAWIGAQVESDFIHITEQSETIIPPPVVPPVITTAPG